MFAVEYATNGTDPQNFCASAKSCRPAYDSSTRSPVQPLVYTKRHTRVIAMYIILLNTHVAIK